MVREPLAPLGKRGEAFGSCIASAPSVARTFSWYGPSLAGVHMADQSTHVSGESGGLMSAAVQLRPPSVLYSTVCTPRVPANATPASVMAPTLTMSPLAGASKRAVVLTTALWSQPCASQ